MIFVLPIKPLGRRKQGLPFQTSFPKEGGSTPWLKVHHHGMDGQDWIQGIFLNLVELLVDGSEIRRSPVEVGSFSHYLQGK